MLTDQEWKFQDYLLELSETYQKPKIDPYEIFNPTKSFLKEVIKGLREQCYTILAESAEDPFATLCNQPRLERLNRKIREYQYRLSSVPKGSGTEITPDTIRRAKESPISDYFTGGKLRQAGNTLVGRCPFHEERSGSFVIYLKQNTFHCFGCGAGTDVIDYIRKTQNLDFISAVKFLCRI